MSPFYTPVLVLHVVIAILGVGMIASVAVVAGAARRAGRRSGDVSAWLGPLLRYSAFSLVAMLLTGVLLDFVVGGAFHEAWWFRGSALLLIATGVLHGQARRALRRRNVLAGPGATSGATSGADTGDGDLRRVEWIAYAMCVLIAAITVLMEAKPF